MTSCGLPAFIRQARTVSNPRKTLQKIFTTLTLFSYLNLIFPRKIMSNPFGAFT
jgi:hypothetical protein